MHENWASVNKNLPLEKLRDTALLEHYEKNVMI